MNDLYNRYTMIHADSFCTYSEAQFSLSLDDVTTARTHPPTPSSHTHTVKSVIDTWWRLYCPGPRAHTHTHARTHSWAQSPSQAGIHFIPSIFLLPSPPSFLRTPEPSDPAMDTTLALSLKTEPSSSDGKPSAAAAWRPLPGGTNRRVSRLKSISRQHCAAASKYHDEIGTIKDTKVHDATLPDLAAPFFLFLGIVSAGYGTRIPKETTFSLLSLTCNNSHTHSTRTV